MKVITNLILIFALIAIGNAQWFGSRQQTTDPILMDSVKALTFKADQWTTTRRTQSTAQLVCTGGSASARSDLMPKVVQCVAKGTDGAGNIQWKCEADLDEKVKFGELEVVCEGFSYPEDPYITRGSCSLEYKLELTDKGIHSNNYHQNSGRNNYNQQQQQQQASYGQPHYTQQPQHHAYNTNTHNSSSHHSSFWDVIMFLVVAAIVVGLVTSCGNSGRHHGQTHQQQQSQTGSTPFPPPGSQQGYNNTSSSTFGTNTSSHSTTNNSGPGFWSGMVGGGLLSYLWNRPRHHQQYGYGHHQQYQQPYYQQPPTYGYSQPSSSSWFGSSNSAPSYSSSSYSSSSPASSPSTTRTASGYGGTRRK